MSEPENIGKTGPGARAERKVDAQQALESQTLFFEETGLALHELQAHQVELEMQNKELRNARAALEISRARYLALYDLAPVGYCTLTREGIILEANLTAATLLGMERGALAKSHFSRFVQKEDEDIFHFHLKRLFKSDQRQVCRLRLLRGGAEQFWARLESILSRDEDGAPLCRMTMNDISEVIKAEEEALAQKEVLEKVFESAPYVMMLVDKEMTVTKINRVCADFSGRSEEEVIGLLAGEAFGCFNSFDKMGCGGSAQCPACGVRSRVMHTFQTGESIHEAEGTITIRKGSAEIDVDILISTALIRNGVSYFVLLTLADVTERTQAQRALRDSEERFRELAENIRDVFWARNSDELLYISPAYEQIWGRSCDSLYRDPASFLESVHPDHRDRLRQTFLASDDEEAALSEEFTVTHPDGTLRRIRARSFPVSRQGRIIRRVGIAEDITAEGDAEKFLRIEKDLVFGLGSSGDLVEGMNNLLVSCLRFDALDSGGIYLVEEETGALKLFCHQGLSNPFLESSTVYESESPQMRFVLKGRTGYWQRPFETLFVSDLVEREGISALLVIPIKYEEELIAVLYLASHSQPQIPHSVQAAFEVIAVQIGRIIARIRLADAVKSQSGRLREANAALKVLLKKREEDRTELEESLLKNVKHLIMPYMAKLKKSRLADEQKNLVEILESYLREITSPFVHKISEPLLGLTPTEIRVADLVRQGKSSKDISDLLAISEYAVVFHRQGIRRKLGLTGKKLNLQTYLGTLQHL